jgi:hypothetical protein
MITSTFEGKKRWGVVNICTSELLIGTSTIFSSIKFNIYLVLQFFEVGHYLAFSQSKDAAIDVMTVSRLVVIYIIHRTYRGCARVAGTKPFKHSLKYF